MTNTSIRVCLLWVIFSDRSNWVPAAIVDRVKTAHNNLLLAAGGDGGDGGVVENPIEKRKLVVVGDEATVLISEVPNNLQQGQQGQQQQQQQQYWQKEEGSDQDCSKEANDFAKPSHDTDPTRSGGDQKATTQFVIGLCAAQT